jgi:hypothetical protein
LVVLGCGAQAFAQSAEVNTVHWAYSTYFGSGWYRVGDETDAFALRYVPRKELADAAIDDAGDRRLGVELRFPVTIGLNHFPLDDLPGSVNPKNFANLSVTPAVYLTWPVNELWTLRPYAALGWGTLLNGDESAWSYWTGVRSRVALRNSVPQIALLNSVGFVGYSPSDGPASGAWPITTALEFRHPSIGGPSAREHWQMHWHFAYTYFQSELDLIGRDSETEPITDQWEIGLAFSRKEATLSIWRLEFDRLGLAYRFSTDGELKGIALVFSSLFDR